MKSNLTLLLLAVGLALHRSVPGRRRFKPPTFAAPSGAFQNVNVEQFEKLRADKKNVVLDVRTKKEFETGHVPGAINIDVNASDFAEKTAKLDKNKTYLVHCAAGKRSVTACEKLAPVGFKHLVNRRRLPCLGRRERGEK
jgi:rhodanese-related sulfurtransferase